LVALLVFPFGPPGAEAIPALGLLAFAAKLALLCVFVALLEVATAKLRLFRLPELFAIALVLAILGALAAVVARGVPGPA
ncbi:MAG TPA: formate hydrogenlyase, partial [Candidatus Thermoplasmatota archaeon]|nr:formate hydrogenlyase [Candidatus Thermoplasmatota archaeon]